ncbi:MAG TPA: intradiol ring-cleavage dioxygenase [Stellaceae bacterium]|nr:intradiol ring-cleavage dioxygenase [Stellaceae bacterium]
MRNLSEANLTEAAIARLARCEDPRFKQIMTSLIRHLHAFVREVEITEAEWFEAIQFLTATGQKCDGDRQEFILLSDVLGVSMLVDAINHRSPDGATESTVLGPFYIEGAPDLPAGADIAHGSPGEATEVSGRVLSVAGKPIAGAVLDVWQTAANGFYSTQDPNQDRFNLRGRFRTDAEGKYRFRTIKPVSYPVPTDGPVGRILNAMGRHPHRPAHIHFIVSAPGYERVATHLFANGDPYLDSDVVFGVKNSLVVDFKPKANGPLLEVTYDFGLKPN